MYQQTVNVPLCTLGNTRPGQKVPGLSSECAVCRHRAAQVRTLKKSNYLGAVTSLRDAVRCNDQEILQVMFAEQNIQQVHQPQNSRHTAACQFLLFPALSTL